MSNIRRSKSTPHVQSAPHTTSPIPRSFSHTSLSTNAISSVVTTSLPSPSVHTPRGEREDPFSLSGFFPLYPTAEEEGKWSWLRRQDEDDDSVSDDADYYDPLAYAYYSPRSDEQLQGIFTQTKIDLAGETIKREDKLGVLELDTVFTMKYDGPLIADDLLLSPYAENEAVDEDSLYLALSRLRARSETDEKRDGGRIGELFFGHGSVDAGSRLSRIFG